MSIRAKRSLYEVLAMTAPAGTPAGETQYTSTKETVDRDVEAVYEGEPADLGGPLGIGESQTA